MPDLKQRAIIRLGKLEIPVPESRAGRTLLGSGLITLGIVGIALPFLGLWMIAPGITILSKDYHLARRWRRRSEVFALRRWRVFRKRRRGPSRPKTLVADEAQALR
jgi:hypothetical protein